MTKWMELLLSCLVCTRLTADQDFFSKFYFQHQTNGLRRTVWLLRLSAVRVPFSIEIWLQADGTLHLLSGRIEYIGVESIFPQLTGWSWHFTCWGSVSHVTLWQNVFYSSNEWGWTEQVSFSNDDKPQDQCEINWQRTYLHPGSAMRWVIEVANVDSPDGDADNRDDLWRGKESSESSVC